MVLLWEEVLTFILEVMYDNIVGIEFYSTCTSTSLEDWESIMSGCRRGNRRKLKRLFKRFYPEESLIEELFAENNPYREVYISEKYAVLVHSGIEYFFELIRN